MPKEFYCSICGAQLTHSRRAIKGKGAILDLIDPHECQGYAIMSNPDEKPTVLDVLENLKDLGKTIETASQERHSGFNFVDGDRRDKKDIVGSSAPPGVIEGVKGSVPSGNSDSDPDTGDFGE